MPTSRASSTRSQPPTSSRPASLTRLPSGNTCETCCATAIGGASWHAVRTAHVDPPADTGVHDGLAYALFLPVVEMLRTLAH